VESHSAEVSASTPGAEPPEATATAPENTRLVVLLIRDGSIVSKVSGVAPLHIETAAAWEPNRAAVEAKYPWLCRMMGTDALIKLALSVMTT
jgi:hypothetical protein